MCSVFCIWASDGTKQSNEYVNIKEILNVTLITFLLESDKNMEACMLYSPESPYFMMYNFQVFGVCTIAIGI